MLPTPSTSHVAFTHIYEPAEDSYLLLDTLSSIEQTTFLADRFSQFPSPLVLEVGTGSGVVLSFVHSNALTIFGRAEILTAGVDVNRYACEATRETVHLAEKEGEDGGSGFYLGNILGDLGGCLKEGMVDVLIFNPPYVPTEDLPALPKVERKEGKLSYEDEGHLLELSYAGGADGMETTDRLLDSLPHVLSERGCAYILLCAQNKPQRVIERIRGWGEEWEVDSVGSSGQTAGWERLQIVRITRVPPGSEEPK